MHETGSLKGVELPVGVGFSGSGVLSRRHGEKKLKNSAAFWKILISICYLVCYTDNSRSCIRLEKSV